MSFEGAKSMDISAALSHIEAVKAMVNPMGANDMELNVLNSIAERLKRGEISPEEATEYANSVQENKQDYH